MRKVLAVLIVFSFLLVFAGVLMADDASTTVNGYVSDSQCKAKGTNAEHAACTKKCIGNGAKMVIVTDSDQKILTVDNADALAGHEGHHVAVTGKVTNDTIHVDSVKML